MDLKDHNHPEAPTGRPAGSRLMEWTHHHTMALVTVILVVAAGVVALSLTRLPSESKKDQAGTNTQPSSSPVASTSSKFLMDYQNVCEQKDAKFTHSIIPLDQLGHIEPLGKMNDAHVTPTDHQYWSPKNRNVPDNTYDVVMPADGTIVDIAKMPKQQIGDALSGTKTINDDYRITVSHSCRHFSIFIHVHKLSDAVTKEVGSIDWGTSKKANVKLKAGELIGRLGGDPVDWTLLDTTATLKGFITPAKYESERWKIHTIDNFSVYTSDIKTQLEAKSVRTAAPIGGKIDYDQPGKLVGTWFRQGSGDYFGDPTKQGQPGYRYWDGHLSIVPDYIDPASTIVSTGNWAGAAKQMAVKGAFNPATLGKSAAPTKLELVKLNYVNPSGQPFNGQSARGQKVSQTEAAQGTMLVQVLDGEKLKVEAFPGKTPAQVTGFTGAAQTYER